MGSTARTLEVILPRTDAGVLLQAAIVATLALVALPLARRWHVLQLWTGTVLLVAGLFGVRALH